MEGLEAAQILGEDGAFQEGWQDLAFPDDTDPLKTDETLAATKDVRSMAKRLVESQKQIGQLSGGRDFAILPNENSDSFEEEDKAFRTKIGVPEESKGYKLNDLPLPEGLPKDEKLALHMEGVLHKAGASPKVAAAIHSGYAAYIKSTIEAAATQEKLDNQEANKQLRTKLGAAYDKTLRDITAIVNAFGAEIDATETAALIKELPYDSFATQLLGKIAARFTEKNLGVPPIPPSGEITPADARSEFNKLTSDPYYMTSSPPGKPVNVALHEELLQKGTKLLEIVTAAK